MYSRFMNHAMRTKVALYLSLLCLAGVLPWRALAQINPAFNANQLISDTAFSDTQTFGGPDGIQKFLDNKGSILASTSPSFLVQLKEPSISLLKQGLNDPEPSLGRLRTAAELIWDASMASGLNPQVILVTLNKEQGLITSSQTLDPGRLQTALDHAMGFACPDSTGCGNLFPGFYYQLFGNFDSDGNRYLGAAQSLMKSFNVSNGRGPSLNGSVSHVGDTITLNNTPSTIYNPPATQDVTLLDRATAALYRYTPHVFNGNYNFWLYFTSWFKYPNGSLIQVNGDGSLYIIENGSRQLVPAFVAQVRHLNPASTTIVSLNELQDYPVGEVYSPADNAIIRLADGSTFVFLDNVKHPVSNFVLTQRGLNPGAAFAVSPTDANLYPTGSILPPTDGAIVKGAKDNAVYLVSNGQLKLFSSFVFSQRKIQANQIIAVPGNEIQTYDREGFVPPLDGTLVKAANDPTIYLVSSGLKQPVLGEIFKNRGLSFKNVVNLGAEEVASLPAGTFATPQDRTFFKVAETGALYIFKEGSKHSISPFVAKQRGITPDYTFHQDAAGQWADGIPVPPKDNTLVKGDGDGTVYVVISGQLRPLTAAAFKARRYSFKNIKTLPQSEVDAYAKGDIIQK